MRAVLVTTGLALVTAGLLVRPVGAADEPGSGLGVFSLQANAPALQVIASDGATCFRNAAADNGCEAVVPEAVSTLRSGPVGHALAAVAWPGTLAAGAGSLLMTVGGSGVPSQATLLNDPVRADAYTSVGKPTQSDDSVPGTTMTATALPAHVSAQAAVGESTVLAAVTARRTEARSAVELTGPRTAAATSHSEVQDVTVAGVLHLASVVSDATATTDGRTATARGRTTASGVTVGGIAVTVDATGVHALGRGSGTGAAQGAVDDALARAGMQVALGAPQGRPQGGAVSYEAQSLVVVFGPPGLTTTVVLGGANVAVAASEGYVVSPARPGTEPSVAALVGTVGAPGTRAAPGPPVTAPWAGPPVVASAEPAVAAAALPDPGPVRTRVVLLVMGGALLLAGLLRRLPDEVLRAVPIDCEETP